MSRQSIQSWIRRQLVNCLYDAEDYLMAGYLIEHYKLTVGLMMTPDPTVKWFASREIGALGGRAYGPSLILAVARCLNDTFHFTPESEVPMPPDPPVPVGQALVDAQMAAEPLAYGGDALTYSYANGVPAEARGGIIVYGWDPSFKKMRSIRVPIADLRQALQGYEESHFEREAA